MSTPMFKRTRRPNKRTEEEAVIDGTNITVPEPCKAEKRSKK